MKPAISVILLTTLIGAGQGLFLAYYSAEVLVRLSILPVAGIEGSVSAGFLSLALLVAGLIASFFHLGHPERAWRAATMWRTSWLSREVIVLPLTMLLIFSYTLLKYRGNTTSAYLPDGTQATLLLGGVAVFVVLVLYLCTAMIYASLKFLAQWHSSLTVFNFLLSGSASGFTLAAAMSTDLDPLLFDYFSSLAIILTAAALLSRLASLHRNKHLRSISSLQSAIGVHHPDIRQLAQGAMGGSFNTRAFIHRYGVTAVKLSKPAFLLTAFVFPVILLMVSDAQSQGLCAAAALIQYLGLLIERWYFFIEAKHPQNLYYQMIS